MAIFAHDPKVDVHALAAALNAVDWDDLGFVCDGRFDCPAQPEQCPLPAGFQSFAPSADCNMVGQTQDNILTPGCVSGDDMVPHLMTALNGPVLELEAKIINAAPEIERWFRGQWQEHTPPFYGSVDLRNAGFKLAPVDMNLFPGGFNNLHESCLPLCVQATMTAIEELSERPPACC